METYQVKINVNGEIVLPLEIRDRLGLVPDDTLDLKVDAHGILISPVEQRQAGPLVDFFEDLILADLRCDGCSGDRLKEKLLEKKLMLSAGLDRLSQRAYREYKYKQALDWRATPELKNYSIAEEENGSFQVVVTTQAERQLHTTPAGILKKIAPVLESMEWDPRVYKRLRGPHYETYRVSVLENGNSNFRVIYTVFPPEKVVAVLTVGERRRIYEQLKQVN